MTDCFSSDGVYLLIGRKHCGKREKIENVGNQHFFPFLQSFFSLHETKGTHHLRNFCFVTCKCFQNFFV